MGLDKRKGAISYRYALNEKGDTVDVLSLTKETREGPWAYTCLGCNGKLSPRLGKHKTKHFYHRSDAECSPETYLHKLGKKVFVSHFNKCKENNDPFIVEIYQPAICTHSKDDMKPCIFDREVVEVDLTKHYDLVGVEVKHEGFIADVMLQKIDSSSVRA